MNGISALINGALESNFASSSICNEKSATWTTALG